MIPVPERRYYSLIDKVYDLRNLCEAWKAVKRNKGAAGGDNINPGSAARCISRRNACLVSMGTRFAILSSPLGSIRFEHKQGR